MIILKYIMGLFKVVVEMFNERTHITVNTPVEDIVKILTEELEQLSFELMTIENKIYERSKEHLRGIIIPEDLKEAIISTVPAHEINAVLNDNYNTANDNFVSMYSAIRDECMQYWEIIPDHRKLLFNKLVYSLLCELFITRLIVNNIQDGTVYLPYLIDRMKVIFEKLKLNSQLMKILVKSEHTEVCNKLIDNYI